MSIPASKQGVTQLPHKPGVYRFLGSDSRSLYIGKAKDLHSRVASYFSSGLIDRPWVRVMLKEATKIAVTLTENEEGALVLEAELIRQHQPRYNLKLTDDKSYPYILLTTEETFPRLTIIRRPVKPKGRLFGPYLSAYSARLTMELLRKAYGIHLAGKVIKPEGNRPCLNCQLESNLCPLAGEISEDKYRIAVSKATTFLSGKDSNELLTTLSLKMTEASKQENFELARSLRDRIQAAKEVLQMPEAGSVSRQCYSAIASAMEGERVAVAIFEIQDGKIIRQSSYLLRGVGSASEAIGRFLTDYYPHFHRPTRQIILLSLPENTKLLSAYLSKLAGKKVKLSVARRGEKWRKLNLAMLNAEASLRLKSSPRNQQDVALWELRELLALDKLPERIEAVDISNLGATGAVGAVVVFEFGRPVKDEYRHYNIKSVTGQNDFAMIEEVVRRRLKDNTRSRPDILLIDGGPEQLKFALLGAGQNIGQTKIIALAKKPDRIYLASKKSALDLPKYHPGLRLLATIRDEAHRFAVSFQRKKRKLKPN